MYNQRDNGTATRPQPPGFRQLPRRIPTIINDFKGMALFRRLQKIPGKVEPSMDEHGSLPIWRRPGKGRMNVLAEWAPDRNASRLCKFYHHPETCESHLASVFDPQSIYKY